MDALALLGGIQLPEFLCLLVVFGILALGVLSASGLGVWKFLSGNKPVSYPMAPPPPEVPPANRASRLRFQNDSSRDWKVICEPWGDERVLPPQASTMLVLAGGDVLLDVVHRDDAIVVHVDSPKSAVFGVVQ